MYKQIIDIVEKAPVGIRLHYPKGLYEHDSADEDPGGPLRQEWLDFDPGDDIV